jgi:hypothetical protein
MSEQDIESQEDAALAKCIRLERLLTATQNRASEIAAQMEVVAQQLRKEPWQITKDSYSWLVPDSLDQAIEDVQRAQADLAAARDAASNLGVTLPPMKQK